MLEREQRYAARVFAITYLLAFVVLMVAFTRFYAPYLVWANGEGTARHFVTHEESIRLYIGSAFLYGVGMLVTLSALYVILRPVSRGMALLAASAKLTYAVFWFVFLLDLLSALRLIDGGGSLRTFGLDGLAALAGSQIDSSRDAYYIGMTFNGLGMTMFSWVFYKSCYVPRALAVWGILTSLYEGFCGFAYLLHPSFGAVLSPNYYELPTLTFELALSVWMLMRGFGSPKTAPTARQG